MTNKLTRFGIVAIALLATPALAETMVEDTDGNGTFSMEEVAVAYPELTEELFSQIDTDASGDVSQDELTAAVEAGVLVTQG
ncbi:EF-hand domain-containing protein [Pseudooceanicola nitratireducens]|jgi:Ca2+-binding EF-hand superfamily protein|uniref:EF-hand domain-containing protein n=1 Tax=Pseudooceanicola nitratireducens TaxID=517719 RepID=UPI001C9433A4|nr:EF-hand domain-containing protein [Pseudooceanicola nitratireducens]MEC7299031.1 EF-hand domain-containing protein [Pseudomonadota bacterium]MBY6165804.1 EF-hand domain-containing protein [Pseudooceanicola nitratireducens]MEC7668429.1 EF-hand domain-containing protein [Pseudomonadota bacterium]MEC7793899.1 EF-hand domain-containing protein [Pseudomonadota bacterium]MEC8669539.1 EF-hand domain-containing protein [Pseudomonadota bacterium]